MPAKGKAKDTLRDYRAKRNFKVTSEPSGQAKARHKLEGGKFVIHKHDATRLHYDLRLEHDGVLWSWAVTRGPSLDPAEKRLAVHVEDHPLDYAKFEGNIPAGEYGAGAVLLWDEGEWTPEFDSAWGLQKGHLHFTLKGNKLNGEWHLVRLKPRRGEKKDNWLLIKAEDRFATPKGDILEDAPQSVKSGLTIEEIRDGVKAPARKGKAGSAKTAAKAKAGTKTRARKGAAKLDFIEPSLAKLQTIPPSGDAWVQEIKFDGYRLQAQVSGDRVRLLTRTGLDWTKRFGTQIADALADLGVESAIFDGEVVVPDEKGISNFSNLQIALSDGAPERMIFYVFDLLHLDGEDLRDEPLVERKARLLDLVGEEQTGPVQYSQHFEQSGKTMLAHAKKLGLEGIISKKADAPYASGRTGDWIKTKTTHNQEFIIAGYLPSDKTGRGIRSLVVAYRKDGKLVTAGHVGTGFSATVATDLLKRMKSLKTDTAPFTGPAARERRVVWLKPELVAQIEFRTWTHDGIIRHASFQGLREDKPAGEVVMEKPEKPTAEKPAKKAAPKASPPRAKAASTKAAPSKSGPGTSTAVRSKAAKSTEAGKPVKLTSPDKELWPDDDVTKKDLLAYYEKVWPRLEQFVVNRPLSLVRAPDGIDGQRFFQKHASAGMHEAIRRIADPEDGEELLYVNNFDGVAALVQFGTVEIHIWGSKLEDIERPDQIIFDLDPDEGLDFDAVRDAALDVREKLDELELPNLVKVTGGKGLHVVVPLKPKADWTVVKTFAHDFAHAMAEAAPERYTATLSKKARTGRIFIDYLRNGRGSTAVAPYSSRARKGATVALPITWEMVADGVKPNAFTIPGNSVAGRLRAKDPWVDFFALGKPLNRSS